MLLPHWFEDGSFTGHTHHFPGFVYLYARRIK
jgi:hypothetical protein